MKGHLLFITFLLLIMACANSGSEESTEPIADEIEDINTTEVREIVLSDTTIQTFIDAAYPGEFIKITDSDQLPNSVIPHLDSIKAFLEGENLIYDSYYVWIDQIKEDSTSLRVPVWDLEGFYFDREHFGEYLGSPSSGCGTLEIELSSGKVIQRWRWQ